MARFNRHDFVLKALLDAVGKQSDYWVMLNADAYYEKGILTDDDMQTIYDAIEAQYIVEEPTEELPTEEEPTDEPVEDEPTEETEAEPTEEEPEPTYSTEPVTE